MNNVIVKLDEAIVSIELKAQKLLAQHIGKIDIYNTECLLGSFRA